MKLITFVFSTVWYFAHAQAEEEIFLRGAQGYIGEQRLCRADNSCGGGRRAEDQQCCYY